MGDRHSMGASSVSYRHNFLVFLSGGQGDVRRAVLFGDRSCS